MALGGHGFGGGGDGSREEPSKTGSGSERPASIAGSKHVSASGADGKPGTGSPAGNAGG